MLLQRNSGYTVQSQPISILTYADDLVVISDSAIGLQQLLHTTTTVAT